MIMEKKKIQKNSAAESIKTSEQNSMEAVSPKQEYTNKLYGEVIVYQPNQSIKIEVSLANETVWLTQQQIALLFGTNRPAITKHIINIYKSGELQEDSTCSKMEHMGNNGVQIYSVKHYNLDVILSVGYRVNSRFTS